MTVLHIASITTDKFSGVCVAVPQHILAQKSYVNVGFINLTNIPIDRIPNQFEYTPNFSIELLPQPFSEPDLVIFHEIYRFEYLKLSHILRKNNIPYVIIPHGGLSAEAQKKKRIKKKIANILLFNRFVNGAVAIQCLSQRELESTHFKPQKFIGTNGINMPLKQKANFHRDRIVFVYIGRLEVHIKGLDLMLNATNSNATLMRCNNVMLDLYGPDWLNRADEIRTMISEKSIGDIVTLNPAITGKEKEEALLDSDMFIQTSRSEGMPMGILEALGYGIPCLVTRGTNLGELIEQYDAGWVAENNASSIAEKINQAICERDKWQMKAVQARRLIDEHFEWNIIAEKMINKYSEIIS